MDILKKHILLVDGMALLFRGFYATSFRGNFMRNEEGIPTNGVYQFLRYFTDGIHTFQPTHVVCCWDMGSKTFRNEIYDAYKANRGAPPEELIPQFDLVKEAVNIFNVPNIGVINYEADDVIGTLANTLSKDTHVTILSGDYDLLQLVAANVDVAIMKKGIGNYDVYNEANFLNKKGLYPHQIIEFKGLTGDSADNYPGIKGIGEKTALKLLQTYGNMDNILQSMDELTKGIRSKIETDIAMFHLSKELAEIKCDVELEFTIDEPLQINATEIEANLIKLGVKHPPIESYVSSNFTV